MKRLTRPDRPRSLHRSGPRSAIAVAALASFAVACGSSDAGSEAAAPTDDGELIVLGADGGAEVADAVEQPLVVEDTGSTAVAEEGSNTEESANAESADAATEEDQALAFAQCMRDEELDWPDPTTGPDGSIDITGGVIGPGTSNQVDVQSDDFAAAVDVCGPLIEGASFLPGAGGVDAETQDTLLEFTQCLRDEGIDVDDPDFGSFQPGGGGLLGDFDPQDPANADAIATCQTLFAGGFGG